MKLFYGLGFMRKVYGHLHMRWIDCKYMFRNEINLLPIFGIFGYVNHIDCWIASIQLSVTVM